MRRWFRTAKGGKLLSNTIDFINASAVKGSTALVRIGQIGLSAFQPLIPLASDFASKLDAILLRTSKWVQSARGQAVLGDIYHSLWNEAKRLWPVIRDLGGGIAGFFDAINQSGIGNQAIRGLQSIASSFASVTRRGSEGRAALNAFLQDTKALMPFVGHAVMAFVKQIGRVASTIITARQEGHKLTILQEIFRGIKRSAGPMADLLIGTFKDLGPEIAKLIPRLTKFFGAFAGSSGPLVVFVRTLNRALKIFNNLPGPMKRLIVNLAAFKLIASSFGGDKILGGMAHFVGQWFILSRLFRKFPATPSVEPAPALGPSVKRTWISKIGAFTKSLGRGFASIFTLPETTPAAARTWKTKLGAFARGLAGVTILATLVLTYDYGKAKKAYAQARKDGKGIGLAAGEAYVQGFKGVPILGSLLKPLINKMHKEINRNKGRGGSVGQIGVGIMDGIVASLTAATPNHVPMQGFLNALLKWWGIKSPSTKAAQKIGRPIAFGILKGFQNAPIIGGVLKVLDALFKRSKGKAGSQKWKPVGSGAAGDILAGFKSGGLVGGAAALIEQWFAKSRSKRKGQAWKPLGSSAAADVLAGFKRGGLIGGAVALIGQWFNKAKAENNKHNWKGIGGGAAGEVAAGFAKGGIVGAVSAVMENAKNAAGDKKKGFWGAGKDAALGFISGFSGVGLATLLAKKISDALDFVRHKNDGHSPWGSTYKLGRDALLGLIKGINDPDLRADLFSGAAKLSDGMINAMADRTADPKLKSKLWGSLDFSGVNKRKLMDLGDPRDALDDILAKRRISSKDARYINQYAPIVSDKFRFMHDDAFKRLAGQMKQFGYSMFEDFTFLKNDAMRRYQGGRQDDSTRQLKDGIVNLGEVSKKVWDRLLSQGWKGNPTDSAERLYAPTNWRMAARSRERDYRRATSPDSPGGKAITAGEMRQIMKEAEAERGRHIYAAAVAAGLDPRALKLLNKIMASSLNHFTNSKPQAV